MERVRRSLGEGEPPMSESYGWQAARLTHVLRVPARFSQPPKPALHWDDA